MNTARKTSVQGRTYILHLDDPRRSDRTLCGRLRASVNRAAGDVSKHDGEGYCRRCWVKQK